MVHGYLLKRAPAVVFESARHCVRTDVQVSRRLQ